MLHAHTSHVFSRNEEYFLENIRCWIDSHLHCETWGEMKVEILLLKNTLVFFLFVVKSIQKYIKIIVIIDVFI